MLERHHPVWVNTHFNHPKELTAEAAEACDRLLRAGIPVGNQSVLLAGINDDVDTMKALCEGLVRMRVRPYYCYQAQLLEGTAHFRVPIERGVELFRALRGRTSGFAIPQYVLDTPYGKVPLALPVSPRAGGRRGRGRGPRRPALARAEPALSAAAATRAPAARRASPRPRRSSPGACCSRARSASCATWCSRRGSARAPRRTPTTPPSSSRTC